MASPGAGDAKGAGFRVARPEEAMTQQKHMKALIRARMSRTGERFAAARLHFVGSSEELVLEQVAAFRAHDRHAIAVAFTPDGSELLSGGFKGQAFVWSTSDWRKVGELRGHTNSVNRFAFSADGSLAVTVSSDTTVRLWDLPAREPIAVLEGHGKGAVAVSLSADGERIATGGYDGIVRLWTVADRAETARFRLGPRMVSVAFHPSEPWIATAATTAEVVVIDPDGDEIARVPMDGDQAVTARWTDDGAFLAASGCLGRVELWAVDGWTPVHRIDVGVVAPLPFAIAPDPSRISIGWPNHVGVWRADADAPAAVIDGLPKGVYSLDFSPDGRLLAQCGADGMVRVWSVRNGSR
jgi:WD40 repeat protein